MKRILTLLALFPAMLAAQSDQPADPVLAFLPLVAILLLGVLVLGVWGRIFIRAGHPRWHSLIMFLPLVNLIVAVRMIQKAGYSGWWILLMLIPVAPLIGSLLLAYADEWPAEKQKREAAEADAAALKTCDPHLRNLQGWLNQSQRKN